MRNTLNTTPIPYEDRLIRWARRHREAVYIDKVLAKISRETGQALPAPPKTSRRKPGDPRTLRGIPVVGVPGGFGGAIKDTRPGANL